MERMCSWRGVTTIVYVQSWYTWVMVNVILLLFHRQVNRQNNDADMTSSGTPTRNLYIAHTNTGERNSYITQITGGGDSYYNSGLLLKASIGILVNWLLFRERYLQIQVMRCQNLM